MKISNRAKSRERKKINHYLIKFRHEVDGDYLSEHDKKSVFLGLRWRARRSHKIEDMRQRISNELVNRTTRNKEALKFEASASGLSL